jgi:hypothetical protein
MRLHPRNGYRGAHVRALEYLVAGGRSCALNLANARGYSVKEVIAAAETVCGHPIQSELVARRQGDARRTNKVVQRHNIYARRHATNKQIWHELNVRRAMWKIIMKYAIYCPKAGIALLSRPSITKTAVPLKPTASPANILIAALLPSLKESPVERLGLPPESSSLTYF